ncbi:MAG: hypothetical protein OXU33_01910 [Gemmatimonadota bacterium]|nr:hypothetical protein [Gemmatimonadota bacterium]MDE3012817.1 hypothetical protein [Gemmatimonadota bacterium]
MPARFRIRTPAGQELSFATLEVFEDFVRSGDLSPDDLVYDAGDGSWSPARTHPRVLEIEQEPEDARASAEMAGQRAEGATSEDDSDADEGSIPGLSLAPEQPQPDDEAGLGVPEPEDSDLGPDPTFAAASGSVLDLELAPPSEMSDAEATRAFVEKMEAEREATLDVGAGSAGGGFSMDDSSTLADMLAPVPPKPAPPEPGPAPRTRPRTRRSRQVELTPRPAKDDGGGGFGRFVLMVIGLGVVGWAGYFGYQMFGDVDVPEREPATPTTSMEPLVVEREPEPEPALNPVIAQTEAAIRERAQERYLTSTQNDFRELPPIPETWASGSYFSLPSDYPEVVTAWGSYLTTIRTVRAEDLTRYADAYERALDDAAIAEEDRGARRDVAMSDFSALAETRASHYDRVEALASAALQSHSALVESEGLILFDPGGRVGGERAMGAGVYGRDAQADLLLSQVVDLLTGRLDAEGLGPGEAAAVRAWVWEGVLDVATR